MKMNSARQLWRPVAGFEQTHEISDQGVVRRKERVLVNCNGIKRRWPAAQLKVTTKSNGYQHITLTHADGSAKTLHVHRMVLESFVGPCPEGCEALHADGNKSNNALNNLRWGTHPENCMDRSRHGSSGKVLDFAKAEQIRALRGSLTQHEIAKRFGVSQCLVSSVQLGKIWKTAQGRAAQ